MLSGNEMAKNPPKQINVEINVDSTGQRTEAHNSKNKTQKQTFRDVLFEQAHERKFR